MPIDGRAFDELDLSSAAFWGQPPPVRALTFAELRRDRPLSFHRPPEGGLIPPTEGFWAVTRHADVVHASRHPDVFCSGEGVSFEDVPPAMAELGGSFLVLDAPRHTLLRRLISRAFTPAAVARIEEQIRDQARCVVRDAIELGTFDVVEHISTRLPLWTISEMIGVPEGERDDVAAWANTVVSTNDPEFIEAGSDGLMALFTAFSELTDLAMRLAEERRTSPADDLMTGLVNATVDGQALTDAEIGSFFVLLAVAGNDTTRNTLSHGIKALSEDPAAWDLLRAAPEERMAAAVEEVIRWSTPVIQFRRTATQDTVLGGQEVRAGERVVLFYESANRDEAVFTDPGMFDITRSPNDHVGFGGGGPHFCLGAQLARAQVRSVLSELTQHVGSISTNDVVYGNGNFVSSVKRLTCSLSRVG